MCGGRATLTYWERDVITGHLSRKSYTHTHTHTHTVHPHTMSSGLHEGGQRCANGPEVQDAARTLGGANAPRLSPLFA